MSRIDRNNEKHSFDSLTTKAMNLTNPNLENNDNSEILENYANENIRTPTSKTTINFFIFSKFEQSLI